MSAADMNTAIQSFFKASHFAVLGASKDPSKFGNKVLAWYLHRALPVNPVHYKEPSILDTPCIKSLADLPDPANTSVSVVSPPPLTRKELEAAVEKGVKNVWLQPGSYDQGLVEELRGKGVSVICEREGMKGHCVLVDGDEGLRGVRGKL